MQRERWMKNEDEKNEMHSCSMEGTVEVGRFCWIVGIFRSGYDQHVRSAIPERFVCAGQIEGGRVKAKGQDTWGHIEQRFYGIM